MNDELEPEILSYREFRNRQTLLAWEQRRRTFESELGRRAESVNSEVEPAKRRPDFRGPLSPQH